MKPITFAPDLTPSDTILLRNLSDDIRRHQERSEGKDTGVTTTLHERKNADGATGKFKAESPLAIFMTPWKRRSDPDLERVLTCM